jgi:hypothetical protein
MNITNIQGVGALNLAIKAEKLECAKYLIEQGAKYFYDDKSIVD